MSSSEWQPRQQDPFARVVARVEKIGRDAEQRVNYLLRNAGLRVAEGALHVLQRLVVEGDQEVTGSLDVSGGAEFMGDTSIGGQLDVTGATTLGGDTEVTGDLTVTEGDVLVQEPGRLYFRRLASEVPGSLFTFLTGEGRTAMRLQPTEASPGSSRDTYLLLEGRSPAYAGNAWLRSGGQLRLLSEGQLDVIGGTGAAFRGHTNFDIGVVGNSHRVWAQDQGTYLTAPDTVGVVSADLYVWGDIGASGQKNFKIVHPLDPTKALVHASTESPVAGLEYTGTATLNDQGEATVTLPDYFEALAAPDSRTVHLTPVGRPFPVGADPIDGGRFTAYGEPGRTVSWLVKARRGDKDGQFEVEPSREEAGIDPPTDQPHTPTGGTL